MTRSRTPERVPASVRCLAMALVRAGRVSRARRAIIAGDLDRANRHAQKLVARDPFAGNGLLADGVREGHVILGHVAVARGDVQRAGRELLLAMEGPTTPVLRSFGPDVGLAALLLSLGHREVVITYLEWVLRAWHDDLVIQSWISAIRAGATDELTGFTTLATRDLSTTCRVGLVTALATPH